MTEYHHGDPIGEWRAERGGTTPPRMAPIRAMSHYVYVVTLNGIPAAIRWELLPAMACIPGHELPTTDIRKTGDRSYVVTYSDNSYPDGAWRITRVDTAPFDPR